jgi:hypothetical protein
MSVPNEYKDPESFTGTVHIHLDENLPPHRTQVCRYMFDTGAAVNLVAERVVHELGLPLIHSEERPTLIGLDAARIIPIGVVFLSFHIDGKKNFHSDMFWVISEATPPLFDLLFGERWIIDNKALKKNHAVCLTRLHLGHSSRNPTLVGIESRAHGLRQANEAIIHAEAVEQLLDTENFVQCSR